MSNMDDTKHGDPCKYIFGLPCMNVAGCLNSLQLTLQINDLSVP